MHALLVRLERHNEQQQSTAAVLVLARTLVYIYEIELMLAKNYHTLGTSFD